MLLGRWVEVTGHAAIEIGDNVMIADGCSLNAHNGGVLKLGQSISVNKNSCLNAADGGEITIGDNVLIAQNVVLRASDHEFKSLNSPINAQGHRPGRIEVDSDVWIAANSVVTSNVKIGSHSIVGAGAVVTMNVENNSIVGGVPARLIKKRVAWEAQKQDLV